MSGPILGLLIPLALAGNTHAQAPVPAVTQLRPSSASAVLRVRNVSIEQTNNGTAVAIASNGALVPAITKLDGPPRLVIDLAGAVNAVSRAAVGAKNSTVRSVRVSQYQQKPPLTRVVVDLAEPRDYAWETVQNKLVVHLRRPKSADEEDDPGDGPPAYTAGLEPALAYAVDAAPVAAIQEVNQNTSGPSSVTAAEETAVLNLTRGGQIRVCPGTTVSVTSSVDRRDIMVGMSTGSFESHYRVTDSADSVLTPDFRILLPGPGQFDVAVSVDSRGNTCVRSLPGNTGSAVVSELMGDGMYQVKPNEQVVFHNGQVGKADHDIPIDCGCPAAPTQVLRAEAPASPALREMPAPRNASGPTETDLVAGNQPNAGGVAVQMPTTTAQVQSAPKRSEMHMQVDAPLIFRGDEPLPAPTEEARNLPVILVPRPAPPVVPLPPPTTPQKSVTAQKTATGSMPANRPAKAHPGFLGRVKHLLSSLFG